MAAGNSNADKKNEARESSKGRAEASETKDPKQSNDCFVIMPISDPEGYEAGHFKHVFEDLFVPASNMAGYQAIRADQVTQTNFIQLDILQRIIDSPMVLCDLSTRNPNVLYELGLRQAFDKPVVLVQEEGTPRMFDVAPFRIYDYKPKMTYHEVLADQRKIAAIIQSTTDPDRSDKGVNSLVRMLAVEKPATLPEIADASREPMMQIVLAEIRRLNEQLTPRVEENARVTYVSGRSEGILPGKLGAIAEGAIENGMSPDKVERFLSHQFQVTRANARYIVQRALLRIDERSHRNEPLGAMAQAFQSFAESGGLALTEDEETNLNEGKRQGR